jgi:hypothetical protein
MHGDLISLIITLVRLMPGWLALSIILFCCAMSYELYKASTYC